MNGHAPPPLPQLENRHRGASVATIVFMGAAVIFAGLAGLLFSRLLQKSFPDGPVQTIVVAARDLPPGQRLLAADLREAQWPESSVPRGSYVSVEALTALDAVPLVPLAAGQAVLAGHLSPPKAGLGVVAKLQPGQRAIAVTCDSGIALAQLPYPGAQVDVLSTFRSADGTAGREITRTKLLLQNITLLAVGPEIDPASAAKGSTRAGVGGWFSQAEENKRRVVTLSVTPAQAEKLVLASHAGKIDLVLRSPQDTAEVVTSGATPEGIYRAGTEALAVARPAARDDSAPLIVENRRRPASTPTRSKPRRANRRKAAALVYSQRGD